MKTGLSGRLLVWLLGLGLAGAPLPAADALPPRPLLGPGAVAPEFSSFDLEGREIRLADFRGKVLVLDFWATWCSPCIASMPHTNEVAARYADQDVVVLAVCTGDTRRRFEAWVKLKAGTYPALRFSCDPHEQGTPAEGERASFARYGVSSIPRQFILDREGKIVATTDGYVPGDNRLEAALAQAGVKVGAGVLAGAAATQQKMNAARTATTGAKVVPPAFTEDAARLKAGTEMPELTLQGPEGRELRTSLFRGRPLVVCFSPAEMIPVEFLERAVAGYGAQGVQVLALVTRDAADNYRNWLGLHRGEFTFATGFDPSGPEAIRDSAVFRAIGMVAPMPFVLVLDARGRLVGKVAPKVATSARGLAELLRRAGVTVAAAELPTPDMFPKPAAASAAAPAAAPAPAPAAAATPANPADAAFAAFVALRSESPPGKPREMGGIEKYFGWVDARANQLMADGLAFYRQYPQDPRRWEVVMTLVGRAPIFMKSFAPKPGDSNPGIKDVVVDDAAKEAWTARIEELKRALLAAADSKPEQREAIEFSDFAAASRGQRAQLQAKPAAEARLAWQALLARFDRHIARYGGNSRLGLEAENFLGAWKDLVPGSLEEGWRHFLDAPDPGVQRAAREKLEALGRLEKPLELSFTATDGRSVDLTQLRGRVVLIDFWATWCGPCKAELPNVVANYRKYHDKGFEVVGIALEDGKFAPGDSPAQREAKLNKAKQVLADFSAQNGMPWPQYCDGKFWKTDLSVRFGIGAIPAMFLVDQEGRVVSTNARGEKLEQELKRLLKL